MGGPGACQAAKLLNNAPTMAIERNTGEILAEHTINPDKDYHPKKQKGPSRRKG